MFVGADGCKAGWLAVALAEDAEWKVEVFPHVSSLWDKHRGASVILLDIPIGLREEGCEERRCDKRARELLGAGRASSVFRAPCRAAIHARSFGKAVEINKRLAGKGFSVQTWNIIPKILEVDDLLGRNESARVRIRETHPEICFWALAGHPMEHSKKGHQGLLERKHVLQSIFAQADDVIDYGLSNWRRKEVAPDDILDALSAAVTAMAGADNLISIPESPEFDSRGLAMQIVYCRMHPPTGLDTT